MLSEGGKKMGKLDTAQKYSILGSKTWGQGGPGPQGSLDQRLGEGVVS